MQLPEIFTIEKNIIPWVQIILALFNKPLTSELLELDTDDQLRAEEWAVKKYTLKILLRLYLHSIPDPKRPIQFYDTFRNSIAPTVQTYIIQFLANLRSGNHWCHPRVSALCLKFLHKSYVKFIFCVLFNYFFLTNMWTELNLLLLIRF